jgi:ABC-2 type transport system permease protein
VNSTIAWITARGLFGRRRFLLLFPLPILLIGLVLVARSFEADPMRHGWGRAILVGLGLAVMLPISALVVGTGVLGSEIEDGTIVHILTKPLPRREILIAKLVVAAGVTAVATAVPMFIAGALTQSVRLGIGLAVGTLLGAIAYSAFFLAMSLLTRRPVLVGLVYVMVWEGLLGNLLSGTRLLSIQQYVVAVSDRIANTDILAPNVSLGVSLVMLAVFTVGSTLFAIDRLRSFSLAGETS